MSEKTNILRILLACIRPVVLNVQNRPHLEVAVNKMEDACVD